VKIQLLFVLLSLSLSLSGQKQEGGSLNVKFGHLRGITLETPISKATCAYSTSGYLEGPDGKTANSTNAEFGQMLLPSLGQGYVLTISPPAKMTAPVGASTLIGALSLTTLL
jgi:hypothetical protein